MPVFIKNLLKDPKFDIAAILVLWALYLIGGNYQKPTIQFNILPFWIIEIQVSHVVLGAVLLGVLATLAIQFAWRRRRSSKPGVESATSPSSKTVA